jgi:hypothetical protein
MTVFGILAAGGARQVKVTVAAGAAAMSVAAPLSTARLGSTPVGDLRFAVLALRGAHCVERLVTTDGAGRSLWGGIPAEHGCE